MDRHPPRLRFTLSILILSLLTLGFTACSPNNISMPAINDATTDARPGNIIWHDLLTDKPEETQAFYAGLLGWQFEVVELKIGLRNLPYVLIRNKGKLIGGMLDQRDLKAKVDVSQWILLMSSTDIEASVQLVRNNGGTVYSDVVDLGERGKIAVVEDTQGAIFALLQTRYGDPAQSDAREGDFLWHELWTHDLNKADVFYHQISGLKSSSADIQTNYLILSDKHGPELGIMPHPLPDMSPVWVTYVRVNNKESLQAILAKVSGLGGDVLIDMVERPGGGYAALIRDPSGAGIALQTWPNPAPVIASTRTTEEK